MLLKLKQRGEGEAKSLSNLVSELLAQALSDDRDEVSHPLRLRTKRMHARVDLEDRGAMQRILDGYGGAGSDERGLSAR